jgi:hypothetical protein
MVRKSQRTHLESPVYRKLEYNYTLLNLSSSVTQSTNIYINNREAIM